MAAFTGAISISSISECICTKQTWHHMKELFVKQEKNTMLHSKDNSIIISCKLVYRKFVY